MPQQPKAPNSSKQAFNSRTRHTPRTSHTRDVPEYAICEGDACGEYYTKALSRVDGQVLCANCADTRHARRRCAICDRVAPSESHHVASKRQHPTLTLPVCLNCHRILSRRQYRWHPSWRTGAHPLRYLIQGVYDVMCLWLERSPVAEQCRELLTMLGRAALCVLPHLRFAALVDLAGLVDWSAM
jgi:hypothetical protein